LKINTSKFIKIAIADLLAVSVGDMSIKLIHDRPSTSGVKSANNNIKSEVTQVNILETKNFLIKKRQISIIKISQMKKRYVGIRPKIP
jgi:hypothetical protein